MVCIICRSWEKAVSKVVLIKFKPCLPQPSPFQLMVLCLLVVQLKNLRFILDFSLSHTHPISNPLGNPIGSIYIQNWSRIHPLLSPHYPYSGPATTSHLSYWDSLLTLLLSFTLAHLHFIFNPAARGSLKTSCYFCVQKPPVVKMAPFSSRIAVSKALCEPALC